MVSSVPVSMSELRISKAGPLVFFLPDRSVFTLALYVPCLLNLGHMTKLEHLGIIHVLYIIYIYIYIMVNLVSVDLS